jgi:hypothetical protein
VRNGLSSSRRGWADLSAEALAKTEGVTRLFIAREPRITLL